MVATRSFSGQFITRETRNRPSPWTPSPSPERVPVVGGLAFLVTAPSSPLAEPQKLRLDAETAGVSCERIKELFLREFGLRDDWRGRINLIINSSLPEDRQPALTGISSPDGWNYELELPKTVPEGVFVRAIVQTLLQELVNRNSPGRTTDVPFWLVEGATAYLESFNVPTYLIHANVQTPGAQDIRIKGLGEVRAALRRHEPLTFEQLSWPTPAQAKGEDEEIYRSCSLLLFENLAHFDDGQACLQRFLREMPKHLNWQIAFLDAFHKHFTSLLHLEKWWSLKCLNFTESDLTEGRTEKECWDKLQAALDVPVEVRLPRSLATTEARLTLQEVIMKWDGSNAMPVLQRAVRNLQDLRWFAFRYEMNLDASAPPAAAQQDVKKRELKDSDVRRLLNPLVDRYLSLLMNYQRRAYAGGNYAGALLYKKDTARQLDALDQERSLLRSKFLATARDAELSSTSGR